LGGRAVIITDLGFGDAGKGTITDFLVRHLKATRVIRYNGGAQAGHRVVTDDGRAHVFAQIGAGAFVEGVRTHLSRFFLLHPTALLVEARHLAALGVPDVLGRIGIHPEARVITPFHQAACRLRELERGDQRHGSCGVGVGETVSDWLQFPEDSLLFKDLLKPNLCLAKLARVQERKRERFLRLEHPEAGGELQLLSDLEVSQRWLSAVGPLVAQVDLEESAWMPNESVVFEGAQGILLDEWRGFHPHTTWSDCTFGQAEQLLEGWSGQRYRLGVMRSYATRHGAGPFPSQDSSLGFDEAHNTLGPWQGGFRSGWPDTVLARYALRACGGIDGLALTHLDRVSPEWKLAVSYPEGELPLAPFHDLDFQQGLTERLFRIQPNYEGVAPEDFVERCQSELDLPVVLGSYGPTASQKEWLKPIF
jgi:adenylosuccinate synthase